jgi:tetratricopeptide (TPR) repeat protein
MRTRGAGTILLLLAALAVPATSSAQEALERGRIAMAAWDLPSARRSLEQAVAADPDSYEANWRLAHVLLDLGKQTPDSIASAERDTLYAHAESYARAAVAANPSGADGHFLLASAIGRVSLTLGKRERIERAVVIRNEALRALGLDPEHDGAYHVMGRWHAEIMRLSGLQKFFARTFLGAGVLDEASWAEAERNLRRAVEIRPGSIYHRLDLAEVLVDREAWADALAQLDALAALSVIEPMDVQYKRQGARLAERIRAQHGR